MARDETTAWTWATEEKVQDRAEDLMRQQDREEAICLARMVLALPQTGWCVLDVETTGFDAHEDRIVAVAVVAPDGAALLETLVNPGRPIPPAATAIHGLTDRVILDAPPYAALHERVIAATRGRQVWIYNRGFDLGFIEASIRRDTLAPLETTAVRDALLLYAAYVGDWSAYHGTYRWQPLPGGDHTAVGDGRAVLALLKRMAGTLLEQEATNVRQP